MNQNTVSNSFGRSPLCSDGRYLYIIYKKKSKKFGTWKVLIIHFQSLTNHQFIVDQFDPCFDMTHVRKVTLKYGDSAKSYYGIPVLNPSCLDDGNFFTNGQYLMVFLPPALATEYSYGPKTSLCRSFSLKDGVLQGNYPIDATFFVGNLGTAVCYDYNNNLIWNYDSLSGEILQFANEGLAPRHVFPKASGTSLPTSRRNSHSSVGMSEISFEMSEATLLAPSLDESTGAPPLAPTSHDALSPAHMFGLQMHEDGVEVAETASILLGTIHRLAVESMPSADLVSALFGSPSSNVLSAMIDNSIWSAGAQSHWVKTIIYDPPISTLKDKLHLLFSKTEETKPQQWWNNSAKQLRKGNFCWEINPRVFWCLHQIMQRFHARLRSLQKVVVMKDHSMAKIDKKDQSEAMLCMQYIVSCLQILKLNFSKLTNFFNECLRKEDSNLLKNPKVELLEMLSPFRPALRLIEELMLAVLHTSLEKDEPTKQLAHLAPSFEEENMPLLRSMIHEECCKVFSIGIGLFYPMAYFQSLFLLDLMNEEESSHSIAQGKRNLLTPLLMMYASHQSASRIALPDCIPSIPETKTPLQKTEGEHYKFHMEKLAKEYPDAKKIFASMISRLFKISMSFTKSANPSHQLILSIQRELFVRCAAGISPNIAPKSKRKDSSDQNAEEGLVMFAKIALEYFVQQFQLMAKESPDKLHIEERISDLQRSSTGVLLPSLLQNLFLLTQSKFSLFFAKEISSLLLELAKMLNELNLKLPEIGNDKLFSIDLEQGIDVPLPSKSVECFFAHPEEKKRTQPAPVVKRVVTVPGAACLSVMFDEHCFTHGPRDFLQLYRDANCSQAIGDRYYGDLSNWPRRKLLIPGDTVTFEFHISEETMGMMAAKKLDMKQIFGFRCAVLGNMMQPEQERLTARVWLVHQQKTVCCVAAYISSLLISGTPLTEDEISTKSIPWSLFNRNDEAAEDVKDTIRFMDPFPYSYDWKELDGRLPSPQVKRNDSEFLFCLLMAQEHQGSSHQKEKKLLNNFITKMKNSKSGLIAKSLTSSQSMEV